MQSRSETGQNWTVGRGGAPVGTRDWADFVRLQLVSQVEHLGEDDESFVGYLELLQEHRAWSLLTRHDGSTFRTREEFCAYKRPWGLGNTWAKLRPYVVSGLAKRGLGEAEIDRRLALDGVPVAMPREESIAVANAARLAETPKPSTPHGEGTRPAHAVTERLRAITRAPEAVQDAYREGRISQTLAAKLGPKDPDGETAARIAAPWGEAGPRGAAASRIRAALTRGPRPVPTARRRQRGGV